MQESGREQVSDDEEKPVQPDDDRVQEVSDMQAESPPTRYSVGTYGSRTIKEQSVKFFNKISYIGTLLNWLGFDPSIRRHSGIWGAADEAVLNTERKKIPHKNIRKKEKKIGLGFGGVGLVERLVGGVTDLDQIHNAQVPVYCTASTLNILSYLSLSYFRLELLPRLCIQEGYLRHVRSEDNENQPVQAVFRLALSWLCSCRNTKMSQSWSWIHSEITCIVLRSSPVPGS